MPRCLHWRLGLAGLLVVLAILSVRGDDTKPVKSALTPEQRQKNLNSFDYVWKTVRDKHYDAKLNGLDWEAVRKELRPKAEKAETTAEVRALMSEMLQRLKQSHFAIIPRDFYIAQEKTDGKEEKKGGPLEALFGEGTSGIEVRVVEGQALVTKVEEKSAAARAGVKTGWVIHKVRGQDMAPVLERALKAYKDSTLLELRLSRAIESRLSGRVGEKLAIVFRDGEDTDKELKITLARPRGRIAGLGNVPGGYVHLEARRLEDNIGYAALNGFFDPVNIRKQFEDALWSQPLADGFIIDLRGNPGGIGAMAMGLGNSFVREPNQKLGTMTLRNGTIHFVLNPQVRTYLGKVAVLIDGCSASTSEILAGGLQDLKRARVFGTRTAGAALPSLIEILPNGDGFQFAIANYTSVGGKVLEGNGVQPDEEVKPDRKVLLTGRDPVIDAAVRWLKEKK